MSSPIMTDAEAEGRAIASAEASTDQLSANQPTTPMDPWIEAFPPAESAITGEAIRTNLSYVRSRLFNRNQPRPRIRLAGLHWDQSQSHWDLRSHQRQIHGHLASTQWMSRQTAHVGVLQQWHGASGCCRYFDAPTWLRCRVHQSIDKRSKMNGDRMHG